MMLVSNENKGGIIKGGTHGDIATIAMVVNSIHRVIDALPRLITMKDLLVVSALGASALSS